MWKSQNTRFIFSPEAAAESLPTCSKESRPCALSKSWSTREPSSACASPACRYGTTCEPSAPTILSAPECSQTFENTAMTLSLPGAFLAKIFHAREKARAYAAREADFGRSLRVSFAKFDPATYSWKIPRFLFQGDWATFSPTWPRYGMMVRGECYPLQPWVADTGVTAFGELSGDGIEDGGGSARMVGTAPCRERPRSAAFKRKTPNLGELVEEERARRASTQWPTVTVHGNGNRSEYGGKSGDGLDTAVKRAGAVSAPWPTPTCAGLDGGSNSRRAARARGRYIEGAGAKSAPWPTPTVHDKIRGQVAMHGREKRQGYGTQGNLNDEVVRRAESAPWPTPKARDCDPTSRNQKPRDDLKCAAEMGRTKSHTYPTIGTKTMGGCSGSFAKLKELEGIGCLTPEERRAMSSHLTGGKDPERADCGMLNPDWVEWLMDWPIWWTDVDFRNTDGWRCRFVWLDPADDPADWPTPLMERITRRKTNRVNRIETLGNGQVPLCAAVAFVFGFEILEVAIYTERKAA